MMQKGFIHNASLALDGFSEMSKVIEQTFGRDIWSKLLSRTAASGLPSYRPGDFVGLLSATALQAFSKAYDGFEKDRNVAIAQVKRLYLQASAFASWRVSKNVYTLDETTCLHLLKTSVGKDVSTDFFKYLPQAATFINLPISLEVGNIEGNKTGSQGAYVIGFVFWPHVDTTFGEDQVLILSVMKNDSNDVFIEPIKSLPLSQSLNFSDVIEDFGIFEQEHERNSFVLRAALVVAMYVCSANAEIHCANPPARPARVSKKPFAASSTVTRYEVGYRIGAAIKGYNVTTHNSGYTHSGAATKMQPHIRRAHFHSFWVGKLGTATRLLRVKWLPPIPVAVDDEGLAQPVIHHVASA